ncbi:unnamed protein product, partial [Mesorhabditis belari]|uniref:Lipopolysaccharide-binding protein n=1 Tax=Mesorhabditis belari TaxID=2138241 RepID=A0AAF3FMM1_9BILA
MRERWRFTWIFIVFHATFESLLAQNYEKDYSPLLDQNASPNNPGMVLRLMPTGLAYLREIGIKVVNEQILKLPLPTIRESIENGEVSIYSAHISKYWAPQEYSLDLVDPNIFTWSMSKMHIRAAGEFEARLNSPLLIPSVPITGHFEALLGHVALTVSVRFTRTSWGAPQVVAAQCRALIGYVDLNVRDTGILTDFFINAFKSFLISNFKPMVEDRMCRMIEKIIDHDMNALLSTMPTKIAIHEENVGVVSETFRLRPPRSKLGQAGFKNMTLLNFVQNLRDRDMVLDYKLTSDPFVNDGAIAMLAKGEISWKGTGGTPFFPPSIRVPASRSVHMVEFVATDYIANSLLYHAYKQKFMDIVVGPESSPSLKDLLQTSCDGGICIGEFLGGLGEQFPHRQVEILFTARKAPLIVFVEKRARFRLHGAINMYVRPSNATQQKQLVLRADTTMTSNVHLWISTGKVIGNATIDNLDFKLIESKIQDVDQGVFADLGLFGAEFLEQLLTEILQIGIKLPTMDGIFIKSPRLSFHERYLKVETYFKLDENYAGQVVHGAVRQTLQNVG